MSPNSEQPEIARRSQQEVAHARAAVFSGRGPEATATEVFDHGRGKLVQAGKPVVQRMAETAQDTAHARAEDAPFTDGGLLSQFERVTCEQESRQPGRDHVGHEFATRKRDDRSVWVSLGGVAAAGALLVILVCRRSSARRVR